jgi:hypothetical protein
LRTASRPSRIWIESVSYCFSVIAVSVYGLSAVQCS